MKKNICINPIDEEMALWSKALWLLNEFKRLGFTERQSFLRVMSEKNSEYEGVDKWNLLTNFWLGRVKSPEVNKDVETVLEQLKSE